MSKACVRVAALSTFFAVGCGASGSGSGDDPFDPSKNPGSQTFGGGGSGNKTGTGSNYFPDELKMNGSGNGTGGGDDKFCATQTVDLSRLPPEIMVVLDRSGSMRRNAQGQTMPPDKWTQTTAALRTVLTDTQANVHWGLKMYPSWRQQGDTACALDGLRVDPGLNQAGALMSQVDMNAPTLDRGATPTAKAVAEATEFLKGRTTKNPKFILLATDGIPNCRDNSDSQTDIPGAVAAVGAAREAGFGVFVVGIAASGIKVNDVDAFAVLNDMANAGGRAREGDTKFYSANNEAELKTALGSIAAQATDCTYALDRTANTDVAVDVNGTRARQGTDWDFGPANRSVVIKGALCQKIKDDPERHKVQIKFGCPGMVIL